MTHNEVYTTQIVPLVKQLMAVCEAGHIATILAFSVGEPEDPKVTVSTSVILGEGFNTPATFVYVAALLSEHPEAVEMLRQVNATSAASGTVH